MNGREVRDKNKDSTYWTHVKSVMEQSRDFDQLLERYNRAQTNDIECLYLFVENGFRYNIEAICYSYSAGDPLDHIRDKALCVALKSVNFALEQIDNAGKKLPVGFIFHPVANAFSLHDLYCTLCWLVCFDIDREELERVVPILAACGQDRFADLVLRQYQPVPRVASGSAAPKVFGLIDSLLDASDEQRPRILVEHLNSWAERMKLIKRSRGLGGASHALLAKSNEDLYRSEVINGVTAAKGGRLDGYIGWWAWEVALAVKVLGIDDSIFADHPLYPLDMVRYSRIEKSSSPWPVSWCEPALEEAVVNRLVSSSFGRVRSILQISDDLNQLEHEFSDGHEASHDQLCRLEAICEELRNRSDADVWVPLLLKLIERTPDSVDMDFSWSLTTALETTWPVYLEALYKSIERQPRSISLCIVDRALRGNERLLEEWRSLLESVAKNPVSSVDAREVAQGILAEKIIGM